MGIKVLTERELNTYEKGYVDNTTKQSVLGEATFNPDHDITVPEHHPFFAENEFVVVETPRQAVMWEWCFSMEKAVAASLSRSDVSEAEMMAKCTAELKRSIKARFDKSRDFNKLRGDPHVGKARG